MKAALYCRLSEEDRDKRQQTDDSVSIQNQKSMLLEYAADRGWEIYSIYSDDDYAGADRGRPAWNQLLQDAEQHKFDIVLCKSQSRFTRELEMVEKYIHGLFPQWGIRFVSIVDNADTEVKGNKKARQINGLINEWYLEDMSDNIKSVLTNRRRNGLHIGSFALFGYRKDPNQKGHLLIDEEAAAVVREVFGLYVKGYGKSAIARALNDRGIPNPTEYKRLQGLRYQPPPSRHATLWRYYTIDCMLRNEIYTGAMVQGKYGSISYKTKQNRPVPKEQWIRVANTHEAIIEPELWEKAQNLLRQRTRPFADGKIGIFAGKAKCAHCGYTMRSSKNHGRYYLKCAVRNASKGACIGSFISVRALEEAVITELRGIFAEYLNRDELERQVAARQVRDDKSDKLTADLAAYKKKLEEYKKGLRDLYLDKVKGTITEAEYVRFAKDFRKEQARLEKQVEDATNALKQLQSKEDVADTLQTLVDRYLELEHLDRETVDALIERIDVRKKDPGTGEIRADIHWNF